MNAYANIGEGFETPTFAELAYRPGGATGLNFALRPATSLHREVGLKALTGGQGHVNVALFRIDTRDEIVVNSSSGGRTDYRNASGTLRKGLEVAWQQQYGMGFLVGAGVDAARCDLQGSVHAGHRRYGGGR